MKAWLCWRDDVLVQVQVRGHAPVVPEAPKDQTILCTAVSCLLRSSAEAVQSLNLSSADWVCELPHEGQFSWSLRCWPKEYLGRLQGVSLVLVSGLRRLAQDYPALELLECAEP